jgi:hypothetical protein
MKVLAKKMLAWVRFPTVASQFLYRVSQKSTYLCSFLTVRPSCGRLIHSTNQSNPNTTETVSAEKYG